MGLAGQVREQAEAPGLDLDLLGMMHCQCLRRRQEEEQGPPAVHASVAAESAIRTRGTRPMCHETPGPSRLAHSAARRAAQRCTARI